MTTPAERTDRIVSTVVGWLTIDESKRRQIEDEFRRAENAALERAVKEIEAMAREPWSFDAKGALSGAATRIRRLIKLTNRETP